MVKSKTSQNILIGGIGAIALITTIMEIIRGIFPELPWDPSIDDKIVQVASVLLTVVLSRKAAFFRNPEKKTK